ncbi:YciI family protein [Pendulispora rubella]|uniref:YciI family protein n=1 Tax=Pendulispora rubella TaxID=2741070 RepID=A0ABZ2LHZ6_9BACT
MIERKSYFILLRSIIDATSLPAVVAEHLQWVAEHAREGRIVASGPSFRPDGTGDVGLTVFDVESFEAAETLAKGDPFFQKKIATFEIRRWDVRDGIATR